MGSATATGQAPWFYARINELQAQNTQLREELTALRDQQNAQVQSLIQSIQTLQAELAVERQRNTRLEERAQTLEDQRNTDQLRAGSPHRRR